MPKPSQQNRKSQPPRNPSRYPPQPPRTEPPELVDPAFLLKALGGTLAVAFILAYLTLCIVYSRGQWQLVLHPSSTVAATPASLGLTATEVHFDNNAAGQPQLDGWWIPAALPAASTALLLHDGTGSMADALPSAAALHNASFNVLLFDYRGFGRSLGPHPTQSSMQQDSESALQYLLTTHGASHGELAVYGIGLGGSLAVHLAKAHGSISAVLLEDPTGDTRARIAADDHSRFVPVWLLFHQDFPLAAPLHTLSTPKLLLAHTAGNTPALFQQAAAPKLTVELPNHNPADLEQALTRFRDTYLH